MNLFLTSALQFMFWPLNPSYQNILWIVSRIVAFWSTRPKYEETWVQLWYWEALNATLSLLFLLFWKLFKVKYFGLPILPPGIKKKVTMQWNEQKCIKYLNYMFYDFNAVLGSALTIYHISLVSIIYMKQNALFILTWNIQCYRLGPVNIGICGAKYTLDFLLVHLSSNSGGVLL